MTDRQQLAKSLRKLVIGSIITEYSILEIKDNTKQDLKFRANRLLQASKSVQNWFLFHPDSTPESKKVFTTEFLKSEIYLISELLELVWGIPEDNLEEIIKTLREHIVEEENHV
jgi:hypothetical protein